MDVLTACLRSRKAHSRRYHNSRSPAAASLLAPDARRSPRALVSRGIAAGPATNSQPAVPRQQAAPLPRAQRPALQCRQTPAAPPLRTPKRPLW